MNELKHQEEKLRLLFMRFLNLTLYLKHILHHMSSLQQLFGDVLLTLF